MKNEKSPMGKIIGILVVVLIAIIVIYINPFGSSEEKTDESLENSTVAASIQTIENTLSSSGQISSGLEEKVYLHTSYYFEELLVEENIYLAEGTKIVEYTNGTYLTAPYDCVMTSYSLPNEDEVCSTSHYIQISSIETLCMNLSVSETDINKIEIGDMVDITMTASGEKIEGFITSISEVGTYSSSGSYFTSVVTFDNPGSLKIGMSASCEIIIESAEDVVAVPVEAIQTSDEGKYVIVVNDDGTTTDTIVETGISNDAYTEIKSGITENTKVQMIQSESSGNSGFTRGNIGFPGGGDMPSGGMQGIPSGGTMPSGMGGGSMPGGMPNMP